MNSTLTQFSRRKGATLGAVIATALGSVLLLCGAGLTPTGNVQTSDVNANGHSITNAATVSATDFVGNGAGITNVPSSSITGLASNYVSTASLTTTLGSYQTALSGTMTATGTSTAQVWMQALDSGYSTFVPVRMSGQNLLCYPTVTGDFNYTVANNTVFTHAASIDCSTITTLRGLDTGTGSPGDSTITVTSTFTHSFPNLAVIQGGSNDGSGNSDGSDTSGYFATYAGNAILKYTGISSAPSIGVQSLTAGADPGSELDYSNLGGYAGNAEFLVTACTSFTYLDLHTVSSIVSANTGYGASAVLEVTDCSSITSLNLSGIGLVSGQYASGGYQSSNASIVINLSSLVSIYLSGGPALGDYTTIDFSGCALPLSQIDSILQWGISGYSNGGGYAPNSTVNLSGGTNAAPGVIPEVDQITIDPSFYDGDSVGIFAADYSINLTIVYAASQTFSSSSYSGGVLTVGISDGPSIDQVCDLIRSTLNSHGGSATYPDDGSGVITNTSSTPAQWTLTCSVADGTTLVAAQAGINGVALASTLASYGPFVITN